MPLRRQMPLSSGRCRRCRADADAAVTFRRFSDDAAAPLRECSLCRQALIIAAIYYCYLFHDERRHLLLLLIRLPRG